jgi:pimeloyl-ACP methyl ester carboxylesterase
LDATRCPGWPTDSWPEFTDKWVRACASDAVLAAWKGPWSAAFTIQAGTHAADFRFHEGELHGVDGSASNSSEFAVAASEEIWAKYLAPLPVRHHQSIFAMLMRIPGFEVRGDMLRFVQSCHLVRRVLEIGKWLASGFPEPVPPSLRAALDTPEESLGRRAPIGSYVEVAADGGPYKIYYESAGEGPVILGLHTAGSDNRQFHRLMAEPGLSGYRFVTFDLPWHGKSPPPTGAIPGSWSLTTDLYVDLVMGFIQAAGLRKPILLGASMSGEICLELALRHPEAFSAIVACEASDHVQGRNVPWAFHPQVNQAIFSPEWVEGLMAPQSPAECAQEVWWHYSQGGFATFRGDISFYSGEWDARDRVGHIDTRKCPLFMLTGEYDYSCTAERSEETAAKIPGAVFRVMHGLGHFPFAENPKLFGTHLQQVLADVGIAVAAGRPVRNLSTD